MTNAEAKKKELAVAHKKIVDWFCTEYEKKVGYKYHFKRGKDGKSLQMIIKFCGPELTCRIIELMFEINKPEYWDLSLLYMNINKYVALYHKKQDELPTPMTRKQEDAHYAKHRRHGGASEPKKLIPGVGND